MKIIIKLIFFCILALISVKFILIQVGKIVSPPGWMINMTDLAYFHYFNNIIQSIIWIFLPILMACVFYKVIKNTIGSDVETEVKERDDEQAKVVLELLNGFKCVGRKALMINAPWGFGKTDFFDTSVKPLLLKHHKEIIKISCFGKNSADDLIAAVLNRTHFIESIGVFFHYIKQILSCSTSLKASLIPNKSMIVLDDFERFSGDYSELLGMVDYLIHKKICKILILCNDDAVENKKYNEFKEKL